MANDTDHTLKRWLCCVIAQAGLAGAAFRLVENIYPHADGDAFRSLACDIARIALDLTPLERPGPCHCILPDDGVIVCAWDIANDTFLGLMGYIAHVLEKAGCHDLSTPLLRLIIHQWSPIIYYSGTLLDDNDDVTGALDDDPTLRAGPTIPRHRADRITRPAGLLLRELVRLRARVGDYCMPRDYSRQQPRHDPHPLPVYLTEQSCLCIVNMSKVICPQNTLERHSIQRESGIGAPEPRILRKGEGKGYTAFSPYTAMLAL